MGRLLSSGKSQKTSNKPFTKNNASGIMLRSTLFIVMLLCMPLVCLAQDKQQDAAVSLDNVSVFGKDRTQKLREGALSVNAVNLGERVNTITSINDIINRTAGVKVRTEGGMGSDFDLSVNGLSGNSIRYFIDGMPLDIKGSGTKLSDLPVNLIQRIEIYKGVVPSTFGTDALGGAVNIITRQEQKNYLDASYTIGDFGTHQLNFNAQLKDSKTGLLFRPVIAYNTSRNDYKMKEIEVWDEESRKYVTTTRRRFHDAYSSLLGQMEVGVMNKRWADAAFISASFSNVNKELQTGATQDRVIGMAERESKAWNIAARYSKRGFLLPNLDLKLSASQTWDHSITTDTCYRKYNWDGTYIPASRNEITGRERSIRHYRRPMTVAMANIGYTLSDLHFLSFNYSLNRIGNDQTDDVSEAFSPSNDVLTKHILALTYNQSLLHDRMQNTFFVKDYINNLWAEQTYMAVTTHANEMAGHSSKNLLGGGIGTRYEFHPLLALKASYERSVRLPLARELLGNATTIYPNMALKPEESNNWNVGIYGTLRLAGKGSRSSRGSKGSSGSSGSRGEDSFHTLSYDINAFLRDVDNFIQPTISEKEGTMQYNNLAAIKVKGIEAEVRYSWADHLNVTANVSWQDSRDKMKVKSDGKPSATYDNRVPNRPWLYANCGADYTFSNLLTKDDKLRLGVDYQWVHWYYLTWESYGYAPTKARIPEQHIIDATATYSLQNGRYNITLGCNNLLDQTAYDNYKLQKPGRYLYAKFRLLIGS